MPWSFKPKIDGFDSLPALKMLTKEQAILIRNARCLHGCSWRRVSELFCERFKIDMDLYGNQIHGMDLCREAAEYFNEDWGSEPWN